jgi:HK97 family phage prohead protease
MNRSFLAGLVKAFDDEASPTGRFEVVLSTPAYDRDHEVVDAGAFHPLPDHIGFDADHGMSTTTTVGSGVPTYEGDRLMVRGTFASTPLAQQVRALVAEGHIRTTSVAYMNPKYEVVDGVRHIVSAELLNGAFVAVPANPQALVLAAKTAGTPGLPGLKTIEGSHEERVGQVAEAVRRAHPDAWWTLVVATFADTVVYELDSDRYQADYRIDEGGDVALTNVRPVTGPTGSTDDEATAAAPASSPVAARARILADMARADVLLAEQAAITI